MRIVHLRRGLAERLTRARGHARYATLAVKAHDLVRDQHFLHARRVLDALHESASEHARHGDLVLGGAQHALQDGIFLSQRIEQRLGACDGTGGVLLPRGDVGLARRLVGLEVAEALALPPQAGGGRGVPDDRKRRWRRVGRADVRKARARAPLLVEHAARKDAARALLRLRATHGVRCDVQPVVGEARQRDALFGVCVVRRRRAGRRWRAGRLRRVIKEARRRRRRRRGAGRHERVLVAKLAVDEDQPGRLLEHVLDHAAAGGVGVAKGRVDSRHATPRAHARGECRKGVASLEYGHLERVRADGAVGGRLRVEAVLEHEAAELGAADDRGEVVLVLAAVLAAARAQAADLVLLAHHLVLCAGLHLEAKAVRRPAHIGEDFVLEPAADLVQEVRRGALDGAIRKHVVLFGRVHDSPALRRLGAHVAARLVDEDERALLGAVGRDGLPLVRSLHELRKVAAASGADALVEVDDLRGERVEDARVHLRHARGVPPPLPLAVGELLRAHRPARFLVKAAIGLAAGRNVAREDVEVLRRDEARDRCDEPPHHAQLGHLAREALGALVGAGGAREVVPRARKVELVQGVAHACALGLTVVDHLARLGVARAALAGHCAPLGRLEEPLARARVHRRVHDRGEAADDDVQREEGGDVGRRVRSLEARLLDALELNVPSAGLEVVDEAHERVYGRKEQRKQNLGKVDYDEINPNGDHGCEHAALYEHLEHVEERLEHQEERVHYDGEAGLDDVSEHTEDDV